MSSQSPADAVLFDFGGTLDAPGVAWKDRARTLFAAALGEADPRLRPERFERAFYDADDSLVGSIPADLSLDETVLELCHRVGRNLGGATAAGNDVARQFLADARAELRTSAGLLESLGKTRRLGVVSNFYGNLAKVCEGEGLAPFLSSIADSAVVGASKPDRRIFEAALAPLGAPAAAALVVGDSWARDVVGARGAGMRAAWLAPSVSEPEREGVPVLRRLSDVRSLLAARGRIEGAGVIAAGDGLRLKGAGLAPHKPLVPVAGVPLVAHVLDGFRAAGFRSLAVIFNGREQACARFVEERYGDLAPRILVKTTASSLESFGEVLKLLPEGRVLVSTVDAFLPPAHLTRFVLAAEATPPEATVLAVTPFVDDENPLRARVAADGRVLSLGTDGDLVTAGLYVVPASLRRRPWPTGLARLRDFLAWVVSSGGDVRAVTIPKVVDVDRPRDVAEAEKLLAETGAW